MLQIRRHRPTKISLLLINQNNGNFLSRWNKILSIQSEIFKLNYSVAKTQFIPKVESYFTISSFMDKHFCFAFLMVKDKIWKDFYQFNMMWYFGAVFIFPIAFLIEEPWIGDNIPLRNAQPNGDSLVLLLPPTHWLTIKIKPTVVNKCINS